MEVEQASKRTFTVLLTGEITTPPLGGNGVAEGDLRLDIKCNGKFCRNDLANITTMVADFVVAQVELLLMPCIETSNIEGIKLLQMETIQ